MRSPSRKLTRRLGELLKKSLERATKLTREAADIEEHADAHPLLRHTVAILMRTDWAKDLGEGKVTSGLRRELVRRITMAEQGQRGTLIDEYVRECEQMLKWKAPSRRQQWEANENSDKMLRAVIQKASEGVIRASMRLLDTAGVAPACPATTTRLHAPFVQ